MTTPAPQPVNGYPIEPPLGPNDPSPTAELTGLAAHLRRLADRVEDLDTRCDQLTDALTTTVLPQLSNIATDTATQLADHADQVQQMLDTLTTQRAAAAPNWPAMNADQAATAWDGLAAWIADTLVPWYEITREQLPDCWALHRPAVIHLAWLHHTYRSAHQPGADPRSAADWHTRWLPAALRAVREAIPRRGAHICGPGQHLVNEADRTRHQPIRVEQRSTPQAGFSNQLAERHNWQSFYDKAVADDLWTRRG